MAPGVFQIRAHPRLGLHRDALHQVPEHAGEFFQQVVELPGFAQADAVRGVGGVEQGRVIVVGEEVAADHPFAVEAQAMDRMVAPDRRRGLAHARNAALQPLPVDRGDMPLQLALKGRAAQLPLGQGQGGVAPQVVVRAADVEQPAFDLIDVALADPDPSDRARYFFRRECAQVHAVWAFEACRT